MSGSAVGFFAAWLAVDAVGGLIVWEMVRGLKDEIAAFRRFTVAPICARVAALEKEAAEAKAGVKTLETLERTQIERDLSIRRQIAAAFCPEDYEDET